VTKCPGVGLKVNLSVATGRERGGFKPRFPGGRWFKQYCDNLSGTCDTSKDDRGVGQRDRRTIETVSEANAIGVHGDGESTPLRPLSISSETGMEISSEGPFPDCHQLASWAAISPGNDEKRRQTQKPKDTTG